MAVLGNTRKAYIALGSSGTPTTWLSGEQTNNFNRTSEAIKALHNGSTVRVFIGVLSGSSPSQGDVFTAIVTAISDTNDTGSVASRTISLTATGEVTHYPSLT